MFTTRKLFTAIVLTASFAHALAANAQSLTKASGSSALSQAITLHDSAVALYSQPARAAQAADLHMRESKVRNATDPAGVEAMIMAGRLYAYSKRPFAARKSLEMAGDRALTIGDVFTAAQAYLDAAFVARDVNTAVARSLARKAYLLSTSPVLETTQRLAIQRRIDSNSALAQLAK